MTLDRVNVLFRRGKEILQSEGLISFIKQAFRSFFSYKTYYIYEKKLNETDEFRFVPKTQNFALKIIYAPLEVDELIDEGFDFSSYSNIENLKEGLSKGAILFCVFIKKELAHTSWVAMSTNTALYDHVFQRINYNKDAGYIGPCDTNPLYRGRGFYPHVLSQICNFLKRNEKTKALVNTSKSNLPSIRGITKAEFKVCSEVRYLKLLFLWDFWKVKTIKGEKQ